MADAQTSSKNSVRSILKHAEAFHQRHRSDAAIQRTFGYFTHHPVAPLNRKRLRLLLDALQEESATLKRPLRVLDLACGGGLITCSMASLGHRVVGVDLSAEEIRMARLFAGEQKLDGLFVQADVPADADWEKRVEAALGGRPDVVTLAYALHHLPQVELFVEKLGGWLNPGAVLLINEENPESPVFRLKHLVRGLIQNDTETEWHRTFSGWKSLLQGSGFLLARPVRGADLIPLLGLLWPAKCWSLVFTAQRG